MTDPLGGQLILVSTPIGNARDITLRALEELRDGQVLVAEDTRTLRRLLEIHGIALQGRPLLAYHDHSGPRDRARVIEALEGGARVVYASEAGTPLIADPGFALVRAAREAGFGVSVAPGVSAVVTALSLAGQPTDRFFFAGFLPAAQGPRRKMLQEVAGIPATLVFYESPNRVAKTLGDMAALFGAERPATLCRELTKKFEEVISGPLEDLAQRAPEARWKGEMVLLVGPPLAGQDSAIDLDGALRDALASQSMKDAVALVTGATGLPRRQVYQRALELLKE